MLESAEFNLLLALTHPIQNQQYQKITETIASATLNWDKFITLMGWHRVTPQVYFNLLAYQASIPDTVLQQLRQANMRCQRTSLQQSGYLVKIAQLFNTHNIQFIVLKGVALSQLLYQDSGKRESKDLDILIDQADLLIAEQLLTTALGFQRVIPPADATEAEISYANQNTKDRVYQHPQDKTELELHWRFIPSPDILSIPFTELMNQAVELQFHKQSIAMLGHDHLWLYQSLHGTVSGWYRLHWLSDIAEMLVQHSPDDWNRLAKLATHYHCQQCLSEALALATQLYQIPLPDSIRSSERFSWQNQLSTPLARRMLLKAQIQPPYTDLWRQLFWMPTKLYYKALALRIAQTPRGSSDWYRQHPGRFILYYLLRPVAIVIRRCLMR